MATLAWKEHAASSPVNEAAGLFLSGDRFVPVDNRSETPDRHFELDMEEHKDLWDEIEGIAHSHTPGPDKGDNGKLMDAWVSPSAGDMASQIATAVPWGISTVKDGLASDPVWWGDQLPIRPLLGRVFIHGINDCFSLIRDQHRLWGINFEDVPRDSQWWVRTDEGQRASLYEELFESRGFVRVDRTQPLIGDCFIGKLHSDVRNHAGVFVSSDAFMHHAAGNLSKRDNGHRWRQKMDFMVRHKDLPEDFQP